MEELEQVKNKMNECQFIIDLHNEINQIEVDIKKVTLTCDITKVRLTIREDGLSNYVDVKFNPSELIEILERKISYKKELLKKRIENIL